MEHDVNDDLEVRLRAARPHMARADENAFDADLLARVRDQPIAARRTVPRAVAVPVAVGVTLTATAVVMLGGGPGDVGGPSSASAITETLRWLNPPSGTILHVRSVETTGAQTTTREFWQDADDPDSERLRTEGAHTFETSGQALYDPATDTIYDAPAGPPTGRDAAKAKRAGAKVAAGGKPAISKPGDHAMLPGDLVVSKVRSLLQEGRMVVGGREVHDGTDAWPVSLKPEAGRPVWTLWVSAADGKPLELRDPGRDASEQPQVIRWPTYEVLPGSDAGRLLTLTGAHPSAQVVRDAAEAAAAGERLGAEKP
ncbi:MAG TPA: hypothetical protein VK501_28450 [Baekduia sp.]|uniref:hypothetical protein n=1 Tax=Baekduia sp. TaxID=2600305 RepID=UPI002C945226|nr:hypothetical protein [Baekduia sp.]HMJ37873.1 hypothetical protein [Baekduia sp.]